VKFYLALLVVLVFVAVNVGSICLHISELSRQIEKSEAELKYFMWRVLEFGDRAVWDSIRDCNTTDGIRSSTEVEDLASSAIPVYRVDTIYDTTYNNVFYLQPDVDSTVLQPDHRVIGYYVDTIVSEEKDIKWELIKNLFGKGGMFSEYRAAGNSRRFSDYDTTFDTVFVLRLEVE